MRSLFRWIVSLLTVALAVVFGTVFRQNIEVFSEARGTHALLRDGWQAVTDLGLASWVAYGLAFFCGATAALWGDHWLRRFLEQRALRRSPPSPKEARLCVLFGDWMETAEWPVLENIEVAFYRPHAHDGITLVIALAKPVPHGYVGLPSSAKRARWREREMTDRLLILDIEGER